MPGAWKRFADYSVTTQNRLKRQCLAISSDDVYSESDGSHNGGPVSEQDDVSEENLNHASGLYELTPINSELGYDDSEWDSVQSDQIAEVNSALSELEFDDSDLNVELIPENREVALNDSDSDSIRSELIAEQREIAEQIHRVDGTEQSELESDQSVVETDSSCESMIYCQYRNSDEELAYTDESSSDIEYAHELIDDRRSECTELRSQNSDNESGVESLMNEEPNRVQRIDDDPLYEGAPLTVSESLISILNLSLRHNVSRVLQTDILKLVALHCLPENQCKTTQYTFNKFFSEAQIPLIRHYYCKTCVLPVETQNSICLTCNDRSKIGYSIEGSIIAQIRALFKRPGFQESLQHRFTRERENPDFYEDIYDGAVYKDLSCNGGFLSNALNISLTWYADGMRIYNSAKFNIWPVYLVINELPFALRAKKENVIFAGLWFGDDKPDVNLFLKPIELSIRDLFDGIYVDIPNAEDPLFVRGIIICGTADLPAKATFLNMKQYNGRFGCQKCKDEGQFLHDARVRVYPYRQFHLRTEEETRLHAQQALDVGFAVCGVKGPTILASMVHEYMRATAVDAMHCVFEGVFKNLVHFWFSSEYSDHPASHIQHVRLVNQRLMLLTPPSFFQRCPRSILDHLPYYKGHELKALFFYYLIPCINDIMDERYFEHYLLLLLGISILFQSSISREEIVVASRALNEFVSRFKHLYGLRNMTNNVHQLLHLPENVIQFGPLWVTSCFQYEDLNGRLKPMVHGSKDAQLQIYSTVSKFLHLTSLKAERLVEGRPAYEFCENLDAKRGKMKRHQIAVDVYIVGKCTQLRQLPRDLDQLFTEANITGLKYFYYSRLVRKNVLYISSEYRRSKKTNSSFTVFTGQDDRKLLGRVRCFIRVTDCICFGLCHCLGRNYAILTRCITENQFSTCIDRTVLRNMHTVIDFENWEQAVDIMNLGSVCIYCYIADTSCTYITEPVNRIEWE